MSGEAKPLLNKNGDLSHINDNGKDGFGLNTLRAVSLIGVGILIGSSWHGNTSPVAVPSPERLDDLPSSSSRNRRFCRIYGDRVKFAGILQTSIGNPSEQWSHIPCYEQPKKSNLLWASSDIETADMNGYGAPDAILRTDFARPAFPNRQPIIGFGAAFTEASSLNYQSLSEEGKARLMELLYGKTGIGYSVGKYKLTSI